MDTNQIIAGLVADATPVKRLRSPMVRMVLWVLASIPAIALLIWYNGGVDSGFAKMIHVPHFDIGMMASLVTGLVAAYAALVASIPGRSQRVLLAPLVPLAIWIGTLGFGCWQDWLTLGPRGVRFGIAWDCMIDTVMMGILPGLVILIMLRRAMPTNRVGAAATAALAAGSLAAFGTSFFHELDRSMIFLIWHVGVVLLVVGIGSLFSRPLLRK